MATAAVEPIEGRQGHYAGAVSRLVAFAADVGASWGLFTLGAAALTFTIQLVSGAKFTLSNYQIASLIAAVVWEFVYFAYQWTLSGKTIGMAVLGIRVVKTDGGADRGPTGGHPDPDPAAQLPRPRAGIPRHPHQPRPARLARPPGRHGRGLLVGRAGRPAALAGPAGLHGIDVTPAP